MIRRITVALAFAAALAFALALPATSQSPVGVTCTFSNRAYAGDCVEKTTRSEKQKPATACKPILDCLNNPQCAKTYCQATTIRQGWTLKQAE